MNRRRSILSALLLPVLTCRADVVVNWNSPSLSIRTVADQPAPSTWVAQLVWSPDNQASPVDPAQPYVPTQGEIVLLAIPLNTSATDGRIVKGEVRSDLPGLAGGYVYTRVFDQPHNGGNPAHPSRYGLSALVSGPLVIQDNDPINGIEITSHLPNLIRVDQSLASLPPAPTLLVGRAGPEWVVSWTAPPGVFTLQQNATLAPADWFTPAFPVQVNGSNHTAVVTLPASGPAYFRLRFPSP